jgi:hypothetical protein
MTGSGKTGLCVGLLEEAAIDGVPAIAIDPKGDIANLLLQFPELRREDFAPWVNEDDARREGLTRDQFAAGQAELWRTGLEQWGQSGDRIRKLRASAEFAVYTPGSSAGIGLSLLKSFAAPAGPASDDRETVRDRVSGTASALLSLLGVDAEPVNSREHILIANILDAAWAAGEDLTVEAFIHRIQTPPMARVGVLDLETFYPAKERFELSMALNNLLASPGFEAWMEGEPLDVSRLLYAPDGKPRISVVSIAHLSDSERMFFVTLLLNEILAWTRTQPGTTSLRAIVYMDEIYGYFPPVSNPPSKRPLLTLLKQARAFGVGIVLATQNPVDLDYKGLANTGTWFIGRLQTERDKQRLIEGLEGAAAEGGGGFDRGRIDALLSRLAKRVFLMNNVHESTPVMFESRWTMSYLRGPLTRTQIKALMADRNTERVSKPAGPLRRQEGAAGARPVFGPDIPQAFVPVRGTHAEIIYQPVLLAAAQVRFVDAKSKIDYLDEAVFLTPVKDDSLPVQWEECLEAEIDASNLDDAPVQQAFFAPLPAAAAKARSYTAWQKDFVNWVYAHRQLQLFSSESLKVWSQPNESEGDFRVRLQQNAREDRDRAIEKIRLKYSTRISTLQDRVRRAEQAMMREKEQSQSQTLGTVLDVGAGVFGALFGRKKLSTAATRAARSAARIRKESGDVGRAEESLEAIKQQLADLEEQIESEVRKVQAQFDPGMAPVETVAIKPKKTNIQVRLFTLAWAPYAKQTAGELSPAWD